MNNPSKSSPASPAKEQPGEQFAAPTQRKEPEVMVANLSGAAAPDVAAMEDEKIPTKL